MGSPSAVYCFAAVVLGAYRQMHPINMDPKRAPGQEILVRVKHEISLLISRTYRNRSFTMAASGVLIILFVAASILWRLYSYLRNDPLVSVNRAHWSARYTGTWIWWQHIRDNTTAAVHQAHLRHGPVVRLGPSEVSVCCVDGGLDVIYGTRERLPKTDWYQVANSHGQEPMVAIKDEHSHRERKKMLQPPYTKTALRTDTRWLNAQATLSGRLKSALDEMSSRSSTMDFYDLAFAWSVDSTTEYVLGPNADSTLLCDLARARCMRKAYEQERSYQFLPLPTIVLKWMGYSPEISWVHQMIERAHSSSPKDSGTVMDHFVRALTRHHKAFKASTSGDINELVFSEIQDHMVAGIDTSAIAFTACTYLLSMPVHHKWQDQLRDELPSVGYSNAADLEKLSVLDAVLKEVLRLYAPVGGSQPRMTPDCVELGPPGHRVMVPKGVTVHSQAHTLHRSNAFPDPDVFDPGRWLHASPEDFTTMKRWYWPFGSGSRACIGMQLGTDNFKIAVATLYRNYRTEVGEGTSFAVSKGVIATPVDQGDYHLRIRLRSTMKYA